MQSVDVDVADVYRDGEKVGKLERTEQGCRYTYEPGYAGEAIAFHLPVGEPIERIGDNLHPFFANLLPEGVRLQSLINRARTSPSDMFSLLIEAGPESVGDVYVAPEGQPVPQAPTATRRSLRGVDFTELLAGALEGANDAAIPGVQDKLSISDSTINLPLSTGSSSAILKLSPSGFPYLVENEAFFLGMANRCGIRVPKYRVVTDVKGRTGLLVDRFDRLKTPQGLRRIHQEDGCQLTDRYPADKYRLSMRSMAEAVQRYASGPIPETLELILRYVFSYLMGNADLHAKNISLGQPRQTTFTEMTPMYDVVCTLLYPKLEQRMALQLDGKDNRFRVRNFIDFGERFGVNEATLVGEIGRLAAKFEPLIERVAELPFEAKDIERAQGMMVERVAELRTG